MNGGDTWFFIPADYVFGHSVERDTSDGVKAAGGKVLGSVKRPLITADFSSLLVQAQASKAKIIGVANGGNDTINAIKQVGEFGIVAGGQNLAAIVMFISDVNRLGLKLAWGLIVTEAYYRDLNDKTCAFGNHFLEEAGYIVVEAGDGAAVEMSGSESARQQLIKKCHFLNKLAFDRD